VSAPRKIRAVIVDDEELARRVLAEFLADHPEVEIVAQCANGYEAVRVVMESNPDLLFLDVQMPKLDGFEVLELLDRDLPVIFVTAYDEHALRAFEVHAVDYLLKPVSAERLGRALEKAQERLGKTTPLPLASLAAEARPEAARYLDRILVRDGSKIHVIPVDRLDYAEARDDYVALFSSAKEYLKHQTLADLESRLDPARFVRIHRSYLVNVDRVAKIEPMAKDSRVAVLTDGKRLPVSRSGYAKIREIS